MNKKNTHNYKQHLNKPMDKVHTIVYIDGDDVKVDIANLLQSFNELRKDIAFLMAEMSEIKEKLKGNASKNVHTQTSGHKSNGRKGQKDVVPKPVTTTK